MSHAVIWHDIECGSYAADLALWEELAGAAAGPVLELGCGSGRVALHLAERGHEVVGLDTDPALVEALNERAAQAGLPARASVADAASFELDRRFSLVVAPMLFVHILGGDAPRGAMLRRVAAHLDPGGLFAAPIVEPHHLVDAEVGDGDDPLPDVREHDGWVYSSLPVALCRDARHTTVERLRQTVSPSGEVFEELDATRLDRLSCELLAAEARGARLRPAGTREIVPTHRHVGSTVCLLEAPADE